MAFRKGVSFRVFYEDDQFCGILYTVEDDKYIFVLYLAVNDRIRLKRYGTKILDWLKQSTEKIIVLTLKQLILLSRMLCREKREFLFIVGMEFMILDADLLLKGENYSVLASDIEHFDLKEYEILLSRFSFGISIKQQNI